MVISLIRNHGAIAVSVRRVGKLCFESFHSENWEAKRLHAERMKRTQTSNFRLYVT